MSRTRSPRRRAKPLRLLQFTDMHLCPDRSGRVKGVDTMESFSRCLEHARSHHWPVDAVLLTGDLVQDDSRAYLELAAIMARETCPVHCVPGNHDLPSEMDALLGQPPFDLSPVLRYGDWTLVHLDSSVPGAAHGQLSADTLKFLDDALARFSDSHVLIVLHHQPVPVGSAWLDSIRLMNGPELLEVVSRHRSVRGMLWGHVHQSFELMHEGIAMMSTPSTCFQFVPGRDDPAIDERPPGYRWLHLYPDGTIDTRVVWVHGK
jgi:Icc protein